MMEAEHMCVVCATPVKDEHKGLGCRICGAWQHFNCGVIDMSAEPYIYMVAEDGSLEYICAACSSGNKIGACGESSLSDKSVKDVKMDILPNDETTYNILVGGTERGGDKLFDSDGYSYTVIRKNPNGSRLWSCCIRGKGNRCPATVKQDGQEFRKGSRSHSHAGTIGAYDAAVVALETTRRAVQEPSRSAVEIAQSVVMQRMDMGMSLRGLKRLTYLARNANNARNRYRQTAPNTVHNEKSLEDIPNEFLLGHLELLESRHILFATKEQLLLLANAKTWYVDSTFKLVNPPFKHIVSINAFIRSGKHSKQAPLLFCMMSNNSEDDYVAVFNKVNSVLSNPASVKRIVMDFEKAIWNAVERALPRVKIHGYPFHYSQAVFNKIKQERLKKIYDKKGLSYFVMQQLLSLCYIPASSIEPVFNRLRRQQTDDKLQKLFGYVQNHWIQSKIWTPSDWSVYDTLVCTNDDLQGWHHRFNKQGHLDIPFDQLVTLLYNEAEFAAGHAVLACEEKIRKVRQKRSSEADAKLYDLWAKFKDGKRTTKQLLQAVARTSLVAVQ